MNVKRRDTQRRLMVLARRLRELEPFLQEELRESENGSSKLLMHLLTDIAVRYGRIARNLKRLYQPSREAHGMALFRKLDSLECLLYIVKEGFDTNHFASPDSEEVLTLAAWQARLTSDVQDKAESLLRKIRGLKALVPEPEQKKAA